MVFSNLSAPGVFAGLKISQTLLGAGFLLELLPYIPVGGNCLTIVVLGWGRAGGWLGEMCVLQINIQIGVRRKTPHPL